MLTTNSPQFFSTYSNNGATLVNEWSNMSEMSERSKTSERSERSERVLRNE